VGAKPGPDGDYWCEGDARGVDLDGQRLELAVEKVQGVDPVLPVSAGTAEELGLLPVELQETVGPLLEARIGKDLLCLGLVVLIARGARIVEPGVGVDAVAARGDRTTGDGLVARILVDAVMEGLHHRLRAGVTELVGQ